VVGMVFLKESRGTLIWREMRIVPLPSEAAGD
jgi:hypothetical protein